MRNLDRNIAMAMATKNEFPAKRKGIKFGQPLVRKYGMDQKPLHNSDEKTSQLILVWCQGAEWVN